MIGKMTNLMAILPGLLLAELRFLLRFAEFLAEEKAKD